LELSRTWGDQEKKTEPSYFYRDMKLPEFEGKDITANPEGKKGLPRRSGLRDSFSPDLRGILWRKYELFKIRGW